MAGSKIAFVIFRTALLVLIVVGLLRERKRGIKIGGIICAVSGCPIYLIWKDTADILFIIAMVAVAIVVAYFNLKDDLFGDSLVKPPLEVSKYKIRKIRGKHG
jgi:hypothetical protein